MTVFNVGNGIWVPFNQELAALAYILRNDAV
jgi:hypothetical protein